MDLITTGHRQISRHVDLTRIQVLGVVAAEGPLRPREIAAILQMTASAVSRHLAALETAGQVVARVDPEDARTFLVEAAPGAADALDAVLDAGTRVFAEVVADWPVQDIRAARALIDRLNQAWAQHKGHVRAPIRPTTDGKS
ncbi:MarR family winged helix-turn-helix transcriptional regulator [Streptomyces sp. NPDC001205]